MRSEGLRKKVGSNHRDESDHHVAADQPRGGGGREDTGLRTPAFEGLGQDTKAWQEGA